MQETTTGAGTSGGKKPLAAFNIIEREGMKKAIWSRVGSAFLNKDGSINVFLDSLPLTGKIQLREDKPFDGPPRGALGRGADAEDIL